MAALIVLVAATAFTAAGWSAGAATIRHASVQLGTGPGGISIVVDVWHDTATGIFAFRLRHGGELSLLRGRTIFGVIDGKLGDVTIYQRSADAWKVIAVRDGLTEARANALLAAGEDVPRPALVTVPQPDPNEYTVTHDYGTDVAALRNAARFAVPSPGPRLDGRVLVDVSLSRTRTRNADDGPVGVITYGSNSSSAIQPLLNIAPPSSAAGASYASFFAKSHKRITGPGFDARITSEGDAIVRYHGSWVLVQLYERTSDSRWRSVLGQIARS